VPPSLKNAPVVPKIGDWRREGLQVTKAKKELRASRSRQDLSRMVQGKAKRKRRREEMANPLGLCGPCSPWQLPTLCDVNDHFI